MKNGDPVVHIPITFYLGDLKGHKAEVRAIKGTVIYVHPKGRYHVAEFQTRGGPIREAFLGT